jgi:hypothetical protein
MKQIQLFDYYVLGKAIEPLFQLSAETPMLKAGFDAVAAYRQLNEVVKTDSVFLPATRRAAEALSALLIRTFGDTLEDGFPMGFVEETKGNLGKKADALVTAARSFETVFKNDSPSMAVFWCEQKGVYSMEGLIDYADEQIHETLRNMLPDQARQDLKSAGRCLAFNTSTASAFHTWRALEVVFGEYYISLTGKTFEDAKIARNWGGYIKALVDAGAERKITDNLDHIRVEYRNPVMHPNVNIPPDEAFDLFSVGTSAVSQVLREIAAHKSAS